MKKNIIITMIIVVLMALLGCDPSVTESTPKGILTVNLSSSIGRGLVPDISLDVTEYKISLKKSEGDEQLRTISSNESSTTFTNLEVGNYTITVSAINKDGVLIGLGRKSVDVKQGENEPCSIVIEELQDKGTFEALFTWSSQLPSNPSISISLKQNGVEMYNLLLSVNGSAARGTIDVSPGYYEIEVTSEGIDISGKDKFTTCRIYANSKTSMTLTIDTQGKITIEIINGVKPTPVIDISHVIEGDNVILTAAVSNMIDGYTSIWLKNNETMDEDGASISVSLSSLSEYDYFTYKIINTEPYVIWSETIAATTLKSFE